MARDSRARSGSSSGSGPRWRRGGRERPSCRLRTDVDFTSVSGRAVEPVYTPLDLPADLQAGARPARASSRSPAASIPTMYRGRLWTMRQFAGFGTAEDTNERYKFLLERGQTGLSVAFDFPDADGLRLRPPPLRGRGGQVRRRDLQPGRHGDAVRRDPARPGLHLDDDQRPRGDAVLLLRRRGGAAGRADRRAPGHDPERHSQGVHGAARLDLPGGAGAQDHRGPVRVGGGAHAEVEHDLDLGLPHPRGGRHRRAGAGVHAGQRVLLRRARARPRARTSTGSRRGSRSSGTSTTTSSRRSPSCAPRAGSGPGTCASATAPGTRGAGRCASTARPPASRSPRSSRTTTSCGWPTRRWPRCWAAPSRSTPTRWTRRWRCPPRSRCAIALRTQQILAYETGVPNVADPLGGSYYVEALTDALEREAEGLFAEIEAQGGVVAGDRDAAGSSGRSPSRRCGSRREVEQRPQDDRRRERLRGGGGGAGRDPEGRGRGRADPARAHGAAPGDARRRAGRRSGSTALRSAAAEDRNIIPAMLDCARAYCTLFEIRHVLEEIYGSYREPVFF